MSAIQFVVNQASETMLHGVTAAGTAYLFAKNMNPVQAAALSAVSAVVSKITNPVFQWLFGGPEANGSSLLLGNALNITTSVAITVALANAVGFSVSVPAFLYLNAVAISTFVLVNLGILAASTEVIESSFLR